jgi:hypothetical protein
VIFGEEERGTFLEEKLEVGLSLHGEHFHGAIAFTSEREHVYGGGAHLLSFIFSSGEEDVLDQDEV